MTVEPFVRELPESRLPLWRIREFSELYVDAMVCDDVGQILFFSVFGRDGAIQQLLAAFHLPSNQGGIDVVTLLKAVDTCPEWTGSARGLVGDPNRFTKLTGKLPRGCFGQLAHVFIYDKAVMAPDQSAGVGWVLSFDSTEADHQARIWSMVKRLLPLPVLDHWQASLLHAVSDQIIHLDREHRAVWPAVGRVRASQVRLDESIRDTISRLVRERVLTREAVAVPRDRSAGAA